MSEPMSANEIEDVLSSIRRLVSQDLNLSDRAKLAAVADATRKLVLLPENRVEVGPLSDQDAPQVTPDTSRRTVRRAAFPPVDSVLANVSAQAGHQEAGAEPAPPDDTQARESTPEAEGAMHDAPLAATDMASVDGLRDAHIEDAVAAHLPKNTTSPPEKSQIGQQIGKSRPGGFFSRYVRKSALRADATDKMDRQAPLIEPDTSGLGAAGAMPDAISPDQTGHAGPNPANGPFADGLAGAPAQAAAAPIDEGVETELWIEEEQLRAMVQGIFREEMAGPMGERITRNIRKLVRAEVGRLLAAQELE